DYFFSPRFHFSRFTFNLAAVFFITIGLIAGSYFTLKGITSIFAASSWTQTDWSGGALSGTVTGTVTTYESLSSTDASTTTGQVTLTNTEKFSNTGFETNLDGWTGFSATGGTITTSGGYIPFILLQVVVHLHRIHLEMLTVL
ncbi:MAG: hypothetical protein U0946_02100, partial [Patescibacteria group bacterium]|nr:hypothetical protein [Patescibacteria group bacterium]